MCHPSITKNMTRNSTTTNKPNITQRSMNTPYTFQTNSNHCSLPIRKLQRILLSNSRQRLCMVIPLSTSCGLTMVLLGSGHRTWAGNCRQRHIAALLAPARCSVSKMVCHILCSGMAPLHDNLGRGKAGVLVRSWNSDRPLVFAHVVLKKMLGVRRAREIRRGSPRIWTSGRGVSTQT